MQRRKTSPNTDLVNVSELYSISSRQGDTQSTGNLHLKVLRKINFVAG
jgi:hypothetical protein